MDLYCLSMIKSLSLYDEAMRDLRTLRYTRKQVADGSGVPFSTVNKIAQGSVKDPSVHNIQAIVDFFRREQARMNMDLREAA